MAVKTVSIGTNTTVHIATAETMVLGLYVNNPTASAITFSVHVFPSTGAANDDTAVAMDVVLPSRDVFYLDMNNRMLLATGDRIAVTASTSGLRSILVYREV